jgi:hypothetical protein
MGLTLSITLATKLADMLQNAVRQTALSPSLELKSPSQTTKSGLQNRGT